jgi:hypothetical protein
VKPHRLHIKTPAARIETLIEEPAGDPVGLALIAHPHPLRGGTLDNKVTQTLARAAVACGLVAVRPNFRGVGGSSGEHAHGLGETDDLVAVATAVAPGFGHLPWTLLGFSFGAYVQHRVAARLRAEGLEARQLILVGAAISMYEFAPPVIPTTLIHGVDDEVIPLAAVRDYAERHAIPLHLLAGTGHFFHGRLVELKALVEGLLCPAGT